MGFKAAVILWDFEQRCLLSQYEIHKVRVESVTFTCNSSYIVSLGGKDDTSVLVWDVEGAEAMCGAQASGGITGDPLLVCPTNKRDRCFLTGGEGTVKVWTIYPDRKQVAGVAVNFGMIKRHVICMAVDDRDEFVYCGTTTGDLMKIKLNFHYDLEVMEPVKPPVLVGCFGKYAGKRRTKSGDPTERYSQGVTCLILMPKDLEDKIILAAGDGTIELVREKAIDVPNPGQIRLPSLPYLRVVKTVHITATPTSLNLMGGTIYVATDTCEVYSIKLSTLELRLHMTCHTDAIFDIVFPHNYSDVFATCSKNDIRVWSTETSLELLRISVPNFTCCCIAFACDGKSIISGWNDGVIRAFTPETGRMIYAIHNSHSKGVTALGITTNGRKIVSGGGEGQVRVWDIKPTKQDLLAILKEHKGPVSSIHMSYTDKEAVSSSTDGTCIVWDIEKMIRNQILFANTQFMCAHFHPTGVQIITTGTDRKIGYWEVYDGSLIRELEGSPSSSLNSLDISSDGVLIVTGGNDNVIKVWQYQEGITTHVGLGHAGTITGVRFSPDNRYIMSVSADGGIICWKSPLTPQPKSSQSASSQHSQSTRSTCSDREAKFKEERKKMATHDTDAESITNLPTSAASRPASGANASGEDPTKVMPSSKAPCNCPDHLKSYCFCDQKAQLPKVSNEVRQQNSLQSQGDKRQCQCPVTQKPYCKCNKKMTKN